jgi:hypothetical protein
MVDDTADLNQAQELVTSFKELTPAFQGWALKMITVGMNSDKNNF